MERDPNLVALMPGSREREVEGLFPQMLEAAQILKEENRDLKFGATGATDVLNNRILKMAAGAGIEIENLPAHEIMQRAGVGVVASGTATLEAACFGLPYCLTYKVAPLTAWVARRVMKVNHLGIVNVMAGREVVRELLQENSTGEAIAAELMRLLSNADVRKELQQNIADVVSTLGKGGAHQNAANAVFSEISD